MGDNHACGHVLCPHCTFELTFKSWHSVLQLGFAMADAVMGLKLIKVGVPY